MAKTIIRGKYVLTKANLQGTSNVIKDGAIVQENGTILDTGKFVSLSQKYPHSDVIGDGNQFLIPGLINAHHHGRGVSSLMMGQTDGHLEKWIHRGWGRRSLDPYLMAMHTLVQQIESGTTTVMFNQTAGLASDTYSEASKTLDAFKAAGVRVAFSLGFRNQSFLVYEEEENFINSLDDRLSQEIQEKINKTKISFSEYMEITNQLNKEYGDSSKIKILLSPQSYHWVDESTLTSIKDQATKQDFGIHMHMLETLYQGIYSQRLHNQSPVERLNNLGFLGPDVSFAHGVWLNDRDLDLMSQTKTGLSHNPSSNLRLSSGIAPILSILKHDIPVGIGTDSTSINDDDDMLQEMALVLRLHRPPGLNSEYISADQVLHMATMGGATITTFGDNLIGSLETGKKADLVLLDWNRIKSPYISEDLDPVEALVSRGRKKDVQSVMIDGKLIYHNGKFTEINPDEIKSQVDSVLSRPTSKDTRNSRKLAKEIEPYIEKYYATWKLESDELYQYNKLK